MTYYAWDDHHLDNALSVEFEYTKKYQESAALPCPLREAACLEIILPAMAQPIEKDDWFFGRRVYRPLGISPSYWNDETDGLDHIAYYADLDRLTRVMNRETQSPEMRQKIGAMVEFWASENVNALVRAHFDAQMQRELPSDLWEVDSGAIFGLYRYAGAQLDYDKLVRLGLPGLRLEVMNRLQQGTDEEGIAFLQGLLQLLDHFTALLRSYEAQANQLPDSPAVLLMRKAAHELQFAAPASYHQAVQLVWLYSAFSGTLDFGRLDEVLGDWYCHDLDNGIITKEDAMAMTLSFYRLMQKTHGRDTRVILGGLGRRNPKEADRFSIFAMEASGIHGEMQPQVSLRMYPGMDQAVRDAAMRLLDKGMTYPLLYNDRASMAASEKNMHLIDPADAEQYAFFGCGEYVIAHKSMGTPNDIINLLKVLEVTLHNGVDPVTGRPHGLALGKFSDFATFDQLFDAYRRQVEYFVGISARHQALVYKIANEKASMLMMSLLMDDCISNARAAADGGIRYLAGTYETYGNISVSDSLTAIKRAVYDEKRFTHDELLHMLDYDFEGYEAERQYLLSLPKFGNDIAEADEIAKQVNDHVFRFTAAQAETNGLSSYLVVMINNSANTVLGRKTAASADGRHAFTYLSNGNNPNAGMDKCGLTAMLHSMASTDMSLTAGTAQNIKLSRRLFHEDRAILDALIDTIFDMGILSLNITVLDKHDLENAMIHPENYANLFVRVGGFSARFIRLSKDVQQDILHRTLY